jgi:hypothetical protein
MSAVVATGGNLFAGVQTNAGPTLNLRLNQTEDNTRIFSYAEQLDIPLPRGVTYHASAPGVYDDNNDYQPGIIPGAGIAKVRSYIFHFDPTSGFPSQNSSAWVEFSGPIYVITHPNNELEASDTPFGIPTWDYANGGFSVADRGFDLNGGDEFRITRPSGNYRLDLEVQASTGMDELRVIEVVGTVPEPASLSMLASAGLLLLRRRASG